MPRSDRGHSPLHLWDDAWLALRSEEVIEPDLPIVDAHHHFWQRRQPYFAREMLEDIRSGHMIRGTVFTECTAMYRADGDPRFAGIGEVEYANGIGAEFASGFHGDVRVCAGIVGRVDLTMGALAGDVLAAYLSRAPDRFRGVRHMAGWDADPVVNSLKVPPPRHLMLDARFREGLGTLGPLGLSFDAHCFHPQLHELIDLVDAFPNIAFVVNHLGGLVLHGVYADDRHTSLGNWQRDLRRLAERPNTFVKIGGLSMRSFGFDFIDGDLPPTSEELSVAWKPLVETCIEAFGPRRAMFESNFPVDRVGVSYRVLWNAFKRITASYTQAERSDLFAGTAVRAYRLPAHLKSRPLPPRVHDDRLLGEASPSGT